MSRKIGSLVYGFGAYLLFLASYLYLVAFASNLTLHSVSAAATVSPVAAALVDLALVLLFGLQHGIMARPAFKRWWTQVVPPHLERSTFVWLAAACVIAMVRFWQPIEGDLWKVGGAAATLLTAISMLGWLGVPAVSFLTDHFDLFGLRQVYEYASGRPRSKPEFKERALYRKVRHPMMLAFLVAFWATPHMTIGHLLFAGLMTSYILIGISYEERDLVRAHGDAYRDYQARVPKLLPIGGNTDSEGTRDAVSSGARGGLRPGDSRASA